MGHHEHLILLSVRSISSRYIGVDHYRGSRGNDSGSGDITTVDSCGGDFIRWGSKVVIVLGTLLFSSFSCSSNLSKVLLVV